MGIDVALPESDEMDEPLGGDRPYTILGELGRGKLRYIEIYTQRSIDSLEAYDWKHD